MLSKIPQPVSITKDDIYVFESQHAKNFKMELGVWNFAKICLIRKGNGFIETKTTSIKIKNDEIVYIPENYPHKFVDKYGSPLTLLMICFSPETFQLTSLFKDSYRHFQKNVLPLQPIDTYKSHRRIDLYKKFKRMVFEQTTKRPEFEIKNWGSLFELIAMISRTAIEVRLIRDSITPKNNFLKSIDYIDENFTEDIKIKTLAAASEISYRHYTSLFKNHKGITVNTYIKELRLGFAKKRLLETENILYSALDSGFSDLSNFYRVFKSDTGMTPQQFIDNYTTE